MPNLSQTDEWIVDTLRNAEIQVPPAELTSQMVQLRPRRQFGKWLAASGLASLAGILVISGTLHPTTSLAQVAAAQAEQNEYTLVNTRILGNGKEFRVTECKAGKRWSIRANTLSNTKAGAIVDKPPVSGVLGVTVMDGSRTVMIQHNPPFFDYVEVDEPRPLRNDYEFDVHRILRTDGKLTQSLGETWQGRRVDRFVVHSMYRDSGRMQTLDQTVIADSNTHLPLRVEQFRDDKSWGDIWEYRYGRPAASAFEINIAPTAAVHDLPKERADLLKVLKTGAVFVNFGQTAHILFPSIHEPVRLVLPVKVNGSPSRLQANLMIRPKLGRIQPTLVTINGKSWELAALVGMPFDDAKNFKPFLGKQVSLKIGDHPLTDVPVIHDISAWTLLRPFIKE